MDCPFYYLLEKMLKEEADDEPGRKKCSLCKKFDHNIRKCPLRQMALTNEKNSSNKD